MGPWRFNLIRHGLNSLKIICHGQRCSAQQYHLYRIDQSSSGLSVSQILVNITCGSRRRRRRLWRLRLWFLWRPACMTLRSVFTCSCANHGQNSKQLESMHRKSPERTNSYGNDGQPIATPFGHCSALILTHSTKTNFPLSEVISTHIFPIDHSPHRL